MEPSEVRSRVAIALGLKMGIDNEKARVVGDTVLRVISECGLITVSSSELARVNAIVAIGMATNARLREALESIAKHEECAGCGGSIFSAEIAAAALSDPDAGIVIEGELAEPAADA